MRNWYDARLVRPAMSGWYDIMTPFGSMACVWYSARNGWEKDSNLEVYAWTFRESEKEILEKVRGK